MHRMVVDFPTPFGPEEARDPPGLTVKERSSTATVRAEPLRQPLDLDHPGNVTRPVGVPDRRAGCAQ